MQNNKKYSIQLYLYIVCICTTCRNSPLKAVWGLIVVCVVQQRRGFFVFGVHKIDAREDTDLHTSILKDLIGCQAGGSIVRQCTHVG